MTTQVASASMTTSSKQFSRIAYYLWHRGAPQAVKIILLALFLLRLAFVQ
jgi:hypothetical protein